MSNIIAAVCTVSTICENTKHQHCHLLSHLGATWAFLGLQFTNDVIKESKQRLLDGSHGIFVQTAESVELGSKQLKATVLQFLVARAARCNSFSLLQFQAAHSNSRLLALKLSGSYWIFGFLLVLSCSEQILPRADTPTKNTCCSCSLLLFLHYSSTVPSCWEAIGTIPNLAGSILKWSYPHPIRSSTRVILVQLVAICWAHQLFHVEIPSCPCWDGIIGICLLITSLQSHQGCNPRWCIFDLEASKQINAFWTQPRYWNLLPMHGNIALWLFDTAPNATPGSRPKLQLATDPWVHSRMMRLASSIFQLKSRNPIIHCFAFEFRCQCIVAFYLPMKLRRCAKCHSSFLLQLHSQVSSLFLPSTSAANQISTLH